MAQNRAQALANPDKTNDEVAAALEVASRIEKPEIPHPPPDRVELPGGLVYKGEVIREVRVQELKGTHEEALARALQPVAGAVEVNWATFLTVLLECGVVQFGDIDEALTRELLKDVLLGDRDALILAIRAATYDDEIELKGWQCPHCQGESDLKLSLTKDVEVIPMGDPRTDATFEVILRKGRKAVVRLATGRDLAAIYEQSGLNGAQRESIQLSRCLQKIIEANGKETRVQGRAAGVAMELGIPDRKTIIRELEKHQPGPRYNGIKFVHQDCQKEVALALGLGDLFPDLF
jgi:hypothetical protein